MTARFAVSMLTLGLMAAASTAEAQRRRGLVDVSPSGERHGFWLNLGIGAGTESSRFEGENNYSSGLTKPAYSVRIGGTVSPNFRLGGEIAGWSDAHFDSQFQENVTSYLVGAMLIGQFYPARRAGFFVKGGGGLSWVGESVAGPGDLSEGGFAWTAGLGYEIKLSRSLFITPTVDFLQHRSQVRENGVVQPALYDRLATIGVALTIQPGR